MTTRSTIVMALWLGGCCMGGSAPTPEPTAPTAAPAVAVATEGHCIHSSGGDRSCQDTWGSGGGVGTYPSRECTMGGDEFGEGACPSDGRIGSCVSASGEVVEIWYAYAGYPGGPATLPDHCDHIGLSLGP